MQIRESVSKNVELVVDYKKEGESSVTFKMYEDPVAEAVNLTRKMSILENNGWVKISGISVSPDRNWVIFRVNFKDLTEVEDFINQYK